MEGLVDGETGAEGRTGEVGEDLGEELVWKRVNRRELRRKEEITSEREVKTTEISHSELGDPLMKGI